MSSNACLSILLFLSLSVAEPRTNESHDVLATEGLRGSVCTDESPILITRCCINHYEENNVCIECPAGQYGTNCSQTCLPGYYGKLCLQICACQPYEKCHHIEGCISFTNKKCKNGICNDTVQKDRDFENSTKYADVVESDTAYNHLHIILIFLAVGIFTGLFLLLGFLIRRNLRSSEKGLSRIMYRAFNKQQTNSSEQIESQPTDNGTVHEGIYEDLRMSQMIHDFSMDCNAVAENRNMQSRYQDSKCLFPAHKSTPRDAVEYSRCDKGKSTVYNQLSLRNWLISDDRDNRKFPCDTGNNWEENERAYGGLQKLWWTSYHFKSLAVCEEENKTEMSGHTISMSDQVDPLSERGVVVDVDRINEMTKTINEYQEHEQPLSENSKEGEYYVLEKVEFKQSKNMSMTQTKGSSNTLTRKV